MGSQNNNNEASAKLNSLQDLLNEYKSYQNTNENYDQSVVDDIEKKIQGATDDNRLLVGGGINYGGFKYGNQIDDDTIAKLQEQVNQAKQNSSKYADRMAAKSAQDSAQSSAGSAQTAAQNTGVNRETAALVGGNKSDINYGNQYIQNRQSMKSSLNDAQNEYLANQASNSKLTQEGNNLQTGAFLNNMNGFLQGFGNGAQVGMGF